MPEIKNYDGKKKSAKRRPHKEMPQDIELVTETEDMINTEAQNEGVTAAPVEEAEMISEGGPAFGEEPTETPEKVHLDFYGSEIIREKAPKVMELADTVADEWIRDGNFEGLPVGHPLAQLAAAKALRTAKDVEKKLEEKGVIAMAKMGVEFVKSKIEKKSR
ncbi:MAG: hypothetical protein AAGB31_01155 [Bdellovibrio sp.]